jgi:hypothetical protein
MTSYVIRGGAEGKARLSVVSAALAPSTAAVLDTAVRDAIHAEAVATPQEMETLATALETFSSDTDTISSFPRIFQASGRRPG